jgi:hypothetical protein
MRTGWALRLLALLDTRRNAPGMAAQIISVQCASCDLLITSDSSSVWPPGTVQVKPCECLYHTRCYHASYLLEKAEQPGCHCGDTIGEVLFYEQVT